MVFDTSTSVTHGGLASGCPRIPDAIQKTQDMISTTQTGAVRCCSFDGGSCKSKIPDCSTLTFSEAEQKCDKFGMRLCSKQELASNICCNTGCMFDLKLVWFTKGNMFCSSKDWFETSHLKRDIHFESVFIKILLQPCPIRVMFSCFLFSLR